MTGGLAVCDPSFIFDWPLARVLAVFYGEAASGVQQVSETDVYEIVNRRRAEKGLEPIKPKEGVKHGR